MKKILAIALSVLMIISVLPFAAFADSVPVADVAKIADADLKGLAADVGNIDLDVGYVFTAREAEAGNMGKVRNQPRELCVRSARPYRCLECGQQYSCECGGRSCS